MTVDECFYCRRGAGLEDEPVGGYLFEDDHFRVGHGHITMAGPGSLLIESRRHVLDLASMAGDELASLNALLPRLYRALHEGLGAERVYLVSTEAFNPHFHAWLYPWRASDEKRGLAFLIQDRSSTPEEAAAAAAIVAGRLSAGDDLQ